MGLMTLFPHTYPDPMRSPPCHGFKDVRASKTQISLIAIDFYGDNNVKCDSAAKSYCESGRLIRVLLLVLIFCYKQKYFCETSHQLTWNKTAN